MRLRNDEALRRAQGLELVETARMENDDSEIADVIIFPTGAGTSRKTACRAGAAVYTPRSFRLQLAPNPYKPLI
jgi:hypothetical protein